jgi:predicted phage terminase large subunit-like protein
MYYETELVEDNTEVKEYLQQEILKRSPYLLGKNVLGFNRYCENHKEWDKWTRQHIDFTGKLPSKNLVLQPRETFKTTFFTVNLVINFLLNNPDDTILIVSSNNANATGILRQIKSILEHNETFRTLFGELVNTENWNTGEITIKTRRNYNQKEATITAVGRGNQITSKHYKRIIFDDICTSDDRDSPAVREATIKYFMDCWDILDKQCGQIFLIGTRWHINDLYAHVFELNKRLPEEDRFNILITPAIDDKGKLNFPNILTQKKLDELRILKVGTDALDQASFEAQYMLRPISSSDQIFKQFHYYDASTAKYEVFIMYCDPAISDKQSACYSAVVVIGRILEPIELKGRWGVHAASIDKRPPTKLVNDMINLHKYLAETFKLDIATYMEQNGFQALMKDNIMKAAMETGYRLPITGRTETMNKDMRISSMEPYVTQGFLLFRDDWRTASGNYNVLMQQLREFPQAQKDAPDALCGAHLISRGRYFNMELTEEKTNG